jgi:PAS domain S-box-containing protein
MDDSDVIDLKMAEEISQFTETYSSFSKIINKIQRQYLTLKETYTRQGEELQAVNRTLQAVASKNQAVSELLDNILNAITSGVIAIDKNGQITNLNPAARKILGLREQTGIPPVTDYDGLIQAVDGAGNSALETLHSGRNIDESEKTIISLDGRKRTLAVSASPLTNRNGEIIGAVELFHDITRLKNMEEQLSRMKVLASLGEMAASIAHEIRNPLGGIGGFAALLARDLADDPNKKAMADKVVAGVANINRTIETLLDFARNEEVHKSEVELAEYLREILADYMDENGAERLHHRLEWNLSDAKGVSTELDPHLFRQALYNLIKNGLEASEKSKVTIRLTAVSNNEARNQFPEISDLGETALLARIDVMDDGPGIAETDMDKIFSPFYSTKQNGTGLGLSIAWKIIQGHGGEIRAESKTGQGTKFLILLPAHNGVLR